MQIRGRNYERRGVILAMLLLLGLASVAEAAGAKTVLILHSFGRDFAPYDSVTTTFRTELARRSTEPTVFVEANLDFQRATSLEEELAFASYLRARFDGAPPDVVVTIGPPAARFHLKYRHELFPTTPTVIGALDERLLPRLPLASSDAVVAGKINFPLLVENILQLLPKTKRIAVVVGNSEFERFWRNEMQREFERFADRVEFEWFGDLSLEQMQHRVAELPPHSAVLYSLLIVDAAGVPLDRQDGLARLHEVSNSPIFGLYENELGHGVVGGPYSPQRVGGEHLATATLRALVGASPQVDIIGFGLPVYDWRELKRWQIKRERLPAESEVRFRPPSIWEVYRTAIVATTTALILQAALILGLLVQRSRRRRAEHEARGLAGRLVTAHEDERRRLARELHDDVTQRLAGLAITAAAGNAAPSIREGLVELSEDIHALSYRLHPSVIEDLGLSEALRIECDRVAQKGQLQVRFDDVDLPRKLPADTALCLFRVAQESLRNVERHAEAKSVDISVRREGGGLELAVCDDGTGFDPLPSGGRVSLGLASMRERVRLLGGRLRIESARGSGTKLFAWVPMQEPA